MDWNYGKFKLLILSIYFTYGFDISSGASVEFVIKNIHSGKYIHPKTTSNIPNNDPLHLWDVETTYNMRHVFVPVDGIWGHIRNKLSGKYWHPLGGFSNSRKEGTDIVLYPTRERWALFAIDQVNNHIIHRDGLFVEYARGYDPYPPNGDRIELTHTVHDGLNWAFLNPNNRSETVYPYGAPKITGKWELVYAVLKPLATQTWEYTYTIGKSVSKSISSSVEYHEGFEFTWESSKSASGGGGFSFWGIGVSAEVGSSSSQGGSKSSSLSRQIASASEDTWYGEVTETGTITVEAGKTVVVWQKVFIGSQLGHKGVFQSNIFGYTDDIDVKPED